MLPSWAMFDDSFSLFENNSIGMPRMEEEYWRERKKATTTTTEWAIKVLAMYCAKDLKFNYVSSYPLQLPGFSDCILMWIITLILFFLLYFLPLSVSLTLRLFFLLTIHMVLLVCVTTNGTSNYIQWLFREKKKWDDISINRSLTYIRLMRVACVRVCGSKSRCRRKQIQT